MSEVSKLCQNCGLYPGTIVIILPSGNLSLCDNCKISIQKKLFGAPLPFQDVKIENLLNSKESTPFVLDSVESILSLLGFSNVPVNVSACPQCGWTLTDFKKTGRWGCSNDYLFFANEIIPMLQRIHGSSQHVGKSPPQKLDINTLKSRMEKAIKEENFEEAARLRDLIKSYQ